MGNIQRVRITRSSFYFWYDSMVGLTLDVHLDQNLGEYEMRKGPAYAETDYNKQVLQDAGYTLYRNVCIHNWIAAHDCELVEYDNNKSALVLLRSEL